MNRRDLFRIGGATAVGTAVLQDVAVGQHVHPVSEASRAEATSPGWKPAVFDAHQNETVIALTELISPETDTPGAKAALVNRYIDLFLADGPIERRAAFLEGLAWLDGFAMRTEAAPFVRLAESAQISILEKVDRGDESAKAGQPFFRMLKSMTASIYYATEAGFSELNKGGRVPTGFGCNGKNSE